MALLNILIIRFLPKMAKNFVGSEARCLVKIIEG
jgi:hypothetical protein